MMYGSSVFSREMRLHDVHMFMSLVGFGMMFANFHV